MSKREKIRTIVIDEVEIVTSLSATEIANLEKENKELKKQLELKDKIIDEMAKAIDNYDVSFHINHYKNIEHIKEVFTNKIKENKE